MNVKKVLILLTVIMMCFTIYTIVSTYALFESKVQKNVKAEIGKWRIKVNSSDITNPTTQNFTINTFNISQSPYIQENKIAPGMDCTFDIEIEPQDTQVSVRYDITIDSSKLVNKSIVLNRVVEKNNNNIIFRTAENVYTGIIPLEMISTNYLDIVEIFFSWENIEENNEEDTKIGTVYNSNLNIPISVTFSQYLGETIEEFEQNGWQILWERIKAKVKVIKL